MWLEPKKSKSLEMETTQHEMCQALLFSVDQQRMDEQGKYQPRRTLRSVRLALMGAFWGFMRQAGSGTASSSFGFVGRLLASRKNINFCRQDG